MYDSTLKSYLKNKIKAKEVVVGVYVKMDNTVFVAFTVNDIGYELKLPKNKPESYYDDYFSRNYPELLI